MWCLSFHHSTFPLFTNKDFFIQGRKVLGCIQIWRAAIKRLNEIKPTFIILEWCIHTNQPCLLNHLVIVYWVCMEFQGVYVGHVNRELSLARSFAMRETGTMGERERRRTAPPVWIYGRAETGYWYSCCFSTNQQLLISLKSPFEVTVNSWTDICSPAEEWTLLQ